MTTNSDGREQAVPPSIPLYLRELRLSLSNNAGAYGFSVMITASLATLSSYFGPPKVYEVFLFISGAVASFALIESLATRGFRRSLRGDETSRVVALGSSLNLLSIAAAVGAAALIGALAPDSVGWLAGSFLACVVYLCGNAAEMVGARRIEEARDLA